LFALIFRIGTFLKIGARLRGADSLHICRARRIGIVKASAIIYRAATIGGTSDERKKRKYKNKNSYARKEYFFWDSIHGK